MAKFTKLEREYVKGIVNNLSFQRLTDREIVQWLHDEKQIDIDRSTVTKIRAQAEQDATKWYVAIRESGSKYVAVYKERLDSLLSYQKKLHEIINQVSSPEIVLRVISELHKIEMSLHTLFKEIPGDIKTSKDVEAEESKKEYLAFEEWKLTYGPGPRIFEDNHYSDEENGKYYWDLHKRHNEYIKNKTGPVVGLDDEWTAEPSKSFDPLSEPHKSIIRETIDPEPVKQILNVDSSNQTTTIQEQGEESEPKQKDTIDLDIAGRFPMPIDYEFNWVQCRYADCSKWFKTNELRSKHIVKYHT